MFNRYFNRQPFNRGAVFTDVEIQGQWRSKLDGWLLVGAEYHTTGRLSASLKGAALPTTGVEIQGNFQSHLLGSLEITQGIVVREQWASHLTGGFNLGANVFILGESLSSALQGGFYLGGDIYTTENLKSLLQGSLFIGADIYTKEEFYSLLLGFLSIYDIQENTLVVSGEIPPDGTLVIDSGNYTMILNETDVIHWHKGDWIFAEPGTVEFILTTLGTQDYNWEVFYIDQYL